MPETSLPSIAGSCLGESPRRYFQSIGLIEAACTRISTSPSAGLRALDLLQAQNLGLSGFA